MTTFEAMLHRTLVQYLVEAGQPELASAVLDADLTVLKSGFDDYGVSINIPAFAHAFIDSDESLKTLLIEAVGTVAFGHITDQNDNSIGRPHVEVRFKLMEVEDDWKAIVRNLIVNRKDGNQGFVSSLMAFKRGASPITYNEMNLASQSEVRIAQEFENRGILFFPLPLAVRSETGHRFKDHREVDFLVCHDGVWGIIEVAFHPGRYEEDAEKASWFKRSGILCVEHYTSERCYNQPGKVVDEFMAVLARHKR